MIFISPVQVLELGETLTTFTLQAFKLNFNLFSLIFNLLVLMV